MAVPSFEAFMHPVLVVLSDGVVRHRGEVQAAVLDAMDLTPEELGETLRGGKNRARNRAYWAIQYLAKAEAVVRPRRGFLQITDIGQDLLAQHPKTLCKADIEHLEGLQEWTRISKEAALERRLAGKALPDDHLITQNEDHSPLESLISAIEVLDQQTATDLVQRLREQEPVFLEQAVLKLLHAMGYGGSLSDGEHLGQSHDGGIDGVIRQDALGLERVYVQAKRYAIGNTVGSAAIREFVGALTGMGASGGVFITTSSFSAEAVKFAKLVMPRVILIDGDELGKLMVKYEVGVTVTQVLKVTEVDENFFDDL
jgi:restriction system protein